MSSSQNIQNIQNCPHSRRSTRLLMWRLGSLLFVFGWPGKNFQHLAIKCKLSLKCQSLKHFENRLEAICFNRLDLAWRVYDLKHLETSHTSEHIWPLLLWAFWCRPLAEHPAVGPAAKCGDCKWSAYHARPRKTRRARFVSEPLHGRHGRDWEFSCKSCTEVSLIVPPSTNDLLPAEKWCPGCQQRWPSPPASTETAQVSMNCSLYTFFMLLLPCVPFYRASFHSTHWVHQEGFFPKLRKLWSLSSPITLRMRKTSTPNSSEPHQLAHGQSTLPLARKTCKHTENLQTTCFFQKEISMSPYCRHPVLKLKEKRTFYCHRVFWSFCCGCNPAFMETSFSGPSSISTICKITIDS